MLFQTKAEFQNEVDNYINSFDKNFGVETYPNGANVYISDREDVKRIIAVLKNIGFRQEMYKETVVMMHVTFSHKKLVRYSRSMTITKYDDGYRIVFKYGQVYRNANIPFTENDI